MRQTWKTVPLDTLHEDPGNVRRHGDRNRSAVRSSLAEFGQVEVLVVEEGTGRVLGGNCRLAEMRALGMTEARVCEVDLHGPDAVRLALALNRSGELAEWDPQGLRAILAELDDLEGLGWSEDDLAAMEEPLPPEDPQPQDQAPTLGQKYTPKITIPIYEPKGLKPPVSDLLDRSKTEALLKQIRSADLPDELRLFLEAAAERHTKFRFDRIAEFYCHAPAEIQALMEQSALVLIDLDKAIENGFVHLTETLSQIANLEAADED